MDPATIRGHVEACPVFEHLAPGEIDELVRQTTLRTLVPGEILFHQGDEGHWAWIVAEGQIRLSKLTRDGEQMIVAFMTPGLLFGVVAALRSFRYPVSAVATTGAVLIGWSREVLQPYLERHPQIAVDAMKIVSERMQELQERFHELATIPVPQRLARVLVKLEEQRIESASPALTLSRQDLAEMIGTTLFTVSRLLKSWDAEGIVKSGREKVIVKDHAKLEELGRRVEESG
ncbi:MAG: Crp/Fnr family transcriptional regulator [Thermoanaerobaculia bacterium]